MRPEGEDMTLPRLGIALSSVCLLSLSIAAFGADAWPGKPIRIVAAGAGGDSDFTARLIAQGISGPLGQSVVVDNRQSILTGEIVAKAPPDGYTLLVNGASVWTYPLLQPTNYDGVKDLAPISQVQRSVGILAVYPALPAKSVSELIALAKSKPGALNYAAGGKGGAQQVATELFASMAGIKLVHVPYKGNSQEINAVISGEVQLIIMDVPLLAPHVKSGKLRALGVTSKTPSALMPGLPPIASAGLPGFEAVKTSAMWAPARTPEAIISRLNMEVVRLLNQPETKQKLLNDGLEAIGSTPAELAAYIGSDIAGINRLIAEGSIKPD
jgi:tripartite-type tricarboxylate transporter receptor subunit TctC